MISREFNGTNIERILKTYGFNKIPIEIKALENSVTNFLNSYFEFGIFFKFNDFKDVLIRNLSEYMHSGLIEKLKEIHTVENIKMSISEIIKEFRELHKIEELDGLAWTNDLKPVLIKYLRDFCDNLFK
jgi:hypothetical protein